jgi:LysM repeat protein
VTRRRRKQGIEGELPAEKPVVQPVAEVQPVRGRRSRRDAAWLAAAIVLLLGAAVAGLLTAYLVATMRAAPPPDAAFLPTPTPVATPSAAPSAGATATVAPTATPAPTPSGPTPQPTPSPTPFEYVVKPGDSITRIAARFGVTPESIIELNELRNPNLIVPDQVLLIPGAPNITPSPSP